MNTTQAAYGSPMGHNNPPSEIEILEERLASHTDLAAEYDRLAQREAPEAIEDEQAAGDITLYLKAVKDLGSRVEKVHKAEKAPYLECGKRVDGWKNDYLANLKTLSDKFAPLLLAFNKKKDEEERQRQLEAAKRAAEEAEKLRQESKAHEDAGIVDTATDLLQAAHDSNRKAESLTINALSAKPGTFGKSRAGGATASIRAPWVGKIENVAAIDLEKLRPFFSEDSLQKAINAFVRDGGRQLNGVNIYQDQQLSIR